MSGPLADRWLRATLVLAALVRVIPPGSGRWAAVAAGLVVLLPPTRLPAAAWSAGHVAAILASGALATVETAEQGLAALVAWLLAHRVSTGRSAGDARAALLFGTGLALLGCLDSESVIQAPVLVGFLLLLPGALLRVQTGAALSRRAGAVGLVAVLLAGALFVLLPRLRGGYFSSERPPRGYAGDVVLGDELDTDDQAIVLRLRPTTVDGTPAPGPFHVRGRVFDHFDGRAWSTSSPERSARPTDTERADLRTEVELEPLADGLLYAPPDILAVTSLNAGALADRNDTFFHRLPPVRIRYVAWSRRGPGVPVAVSDADRAAWLQVPALDGRVVSLAHTIAPDEQDPARLAAAVSAWLSTNLAYTPDPELVTGDPLPTFLFETRTGHCEYFASAATMLLRVRGVPARLATGFWSGELDEEGRVVVRAGQAHAWVEVPTGDGWVTVDPSPLEARPTLPPSTLLAWMSRAQDRWSRWVVDFNLDNQFNGLIAIGEGFAATTGAAPPALPAFTGFNVLVGALAGLYGLAVVGQLVAGRVLLPGKGRPDPLARELDRARRHLRRRGWSPPPLPPRALARWLQDRVGEAARPLHELADAVYGARYGGEDPDEALRRARAAVKALSTLPRPEPRP